MSMTGYGRVEAQLEDSTWVWEVRAVNGKNLDMRLRLPAGFESLDPLIRRKVKAGLVRGNLQINLDMSASSGDNDYAVNEVWLQTLIENAALMHKQNPQVLPPRMDGLYLVRGVVSESTQSAADPKFKARNKAVMVSLDDMLANLMQARAIEGKALAKILKSNVKAFEALIAKARICEGALAGNIKQKFEQKMMELLSEDLPQDKLLQEATLLAIKADIREELDRLDAHIDQAKTLLKAGSPVGRKLDFLCQEFIREINTLCSKSTDIELTQIGLDMKSLTEQFREQAANVE
ncbi:MAG: YicC family protein [Robiginitomaculum sp.]|nr:YicC family protein [Robiginitomaculum sp.]